MGTSPRTDAHTDDAGPGTAPAPAGTGRGAPPRVSVGMPVYNSEAHVEEAVRAHLAQTLGDFELIVCDNASTDGTAEICRALAEEDRRIRYHRNPRNLGAVRNYERCFELARGPLFTWSASDDVCHPRYLEACVTALDADPEAVLAFSPARVTDGDLRPLRDEPDHPALESPDAARRFRHIANLHTDLASTIFGVIRSRVLARVLPHGRYAGADRMLVAALALEGRFVQVRPGLLTWRRHEEQYTSSFDSSHFATGFWDPTREGEVAFANWRRLGGMLSAAWSAPPHAGGRLRATAEVVRWAGRHHRRLAYDLVVVPPHRLRRRWAGGDTSSDTDLDVTPDPTREPTQEPEEALT